MSVVETIASLLVAGLALYGVGLPLAWLLPAPRDAQWLFRIAVAPVYSIVVAWLAASVLGALGVPLRPIQLVVIGGAAWAIGWRFARGGWRTPDVRAVIAPVSMVVTAGVVWAVSMLGYGLYLPNRDFKNHAYWVAQVASAHSADPALVLRATPLSAPAEESFYPLGLHTLLGWAVPTPDWNTLGVTAAAVVLCTSVSLPLAGVVLARLWLPNDGLASTVSGFALAFFPGMTGAFQIGSVTILVAGALYSAGLASLWMWLRRPRFAETVALATAGLGLFLLHIAEGWGLLLVTIASLPLMGISGLARIRARNWALLAATAVVVLVVAVSVVRPILPSLVEGFLDIQPNDQSVPLALVRAFLSQPGGNSLLGLLWMLLALVGVGLAIRRRLFLLPVVALVVPMVLAVFASTPGVPAALNALTAPWYGSDSRIYLMAGPPIALLGALAISTSRTIVTHRGDSDQGASRAVAAWVVAPGILLLIAISAPLVQERREDLAATLAGASDTPELADRLRDALAPGETVLTFEGDGTANLFAMARLPVLSGWEDYELPVTEGRDYTWLISSLMNLDDPEVASALESLNVRFVAIGTTSIYWDPQVGYDVDLLLQNSQLDEYDKGHHMTVLEYSAEGRP